MLASVGVPSMYVRGVVGRGGGAARLVRAREGWGLMNLASFGGRRGGQMVEERGMFVFGRRKMSRLMDEFDDINREKARSKRTGPSVPSSIEWKGPLEVIKYPDPRLRAENKPIEEFGAPLQEIAKEMFEVMYSDNGCGLAAPQVGINYRLMVFNPEGRRGKGEEMILANPHIVAKGDEQDWFREGCLSFPGMLGEVERPTKVKIRAQDVNGKDVEFELEGFTARVFQHEFDHLQGTLFHDRMPDREIAAIHHKLVNLEDEYVKTNPNEKDNIQRVGPKPDVKMFGIF
eukprot:CAMPEP_0197536852 /NCGR_PEP_ID=MMETSP1318-20131121/55064_1 /TAXON_ID=552666 /ORGANISM="Partenskyella glossopodia, Strain RCC365" /LENGTH=287 /DNA_ID=CAMNT_0043094863 /DNA_START=159 /DNA_END=1022 /DNA_ORIENTATION=-